MNTGRELTMDKLSFRLGVVILVALSCFFIGCTSIGSKEAQNTNRKFIFLNADRLEIAGQKIKENDTLYVKAFRNIIALANKELKKKVDPVTNKTIIAASGNIHDYHTIGSYYWPDTTKADGLPWIYKDGVFNRISIGLATDWDRRRLMLISLNTLNLAYYFSGDEKYILKAREIVRTWFVNEETKMNPNVDYGKAIPGKVSGTNFAIIDWADIGKVITTIQMLKQNNLWSKEDKAVMDKWFQDYYKWLTESEFGILESTRKNNHATNYDYQLIGIMIYLGMIDEVATKLEEVKKKRIATQIDPDGSQPHELSRTKSVNYTVNNLWALARIADLGRRFTSVDLWEYQCENGASIKKAYDFVIPYFTAEDTWSWKQITGGGADKQLANLALPMFSRSELMLGVNILPAELECFDKFTPHEVLMYAPN